MKAHFFSFFLSLFLFHCCLHLAPAPATATLPTVDKVVVLKSERVLILMKGETILKSYKVALGRNPIGPKIAQGDYRTPEGTYNLDWRNPNSRFYRSLHISYPSPADIEKAKALNLSPGRDIMIHGLPKGYDDVGELHRKYNWTKGCIAVTNAEIDEIWNLVPDGTPIEIRP